jgi:hypothetical protein
MPALTAPRNQRIERKDYKKRSRRAHRPEVTLPSPNLYISTETPESLSPPPSTPPPPPPVLGFPSPTSPTLAPPPACFVRADDSTSDESGADDSDDEDEFEDSEQTEATAPGTDVEESVTLSEGELCGAMPVLSGGGLSRTGDEKWVAVKGQGHAAAAATTTLAPPYLSSVDPASEAVHVTAATYAPAQHS